MVKRMVSVLLLLCTVTVAGFTEGKQETAKEARDPNTILVGFSFNALLNDVFTKTEQFTKEIGAESTPKVEFIVTSADSDVSKQIADVNDLINRSPDAIIVSPVDAASTDIIIKNCQDAGIPVMIQNRPYNPNGKYKPDTFVGVDAEDQGYAATKEVFDIMIKDGYTEMNLICISGALTDQNSVLRASGVMKAIDEYSNRGAKLVTELTTDWKPDWLEANLPSAMRANPDANCLYIASDYLLPATQSGLESTSQWVPYGKPGHIYIASTDVYKEGLDAIAAGYVDTDALFDIVGMCEKIVEYSTALSKGEKPAEIYVKGPVFNRENYNDPEMQKRLW